jgi:hypothetical protein
MNRLALITAVIACLFVTSIAEAANSPTGAYKAQITSNLYGGELKGEWGIAFKNGAYTVTDKGTAVVHGLYTIGGTKITFTDKSGKDLCLGTGAYTFKLTGSTLKFTKVKDTTACAARSAVLAGSFTKTSM